MAIRHYLAIAEQIAGGDQLWISFPALAGVTSSADNFETLMSQAKDALARAIDDMGAGGEDPPVPFEQDPSSAKYDHSRYQNAYALLVPVETSGRAVRANISMAEGSLGRADEIAHRAGTNHSALLARGAKMVIADETEGA
jgi:hypothetical protein